jgi:hypothetical protein
MPFDGMFIHINQSWLVMDGGKPLSYDSIYSDISVLKGVFKKFKYNYLYVFIRYPGDFWDDRVWEITAQNFAKMAKAAKAVGFHGIVYDNEEYGSGTTVRKWLNYGEVYRNPNYDLNQHRDQVMLRGKQVMEAMVKEFPDIEIFTFHGPYLSEPKTPYERIVMEQAAGWQTRELLGPFFVGMLQGKGEKAKMIDGGEVYQYRTKEDFEFSYKWRKYGIASDETDSWFIPKEVRKTWATDVEISFGVYNRTWKEKYPMSPAIMETTLENALRTTDKYVWYWTERDSWFIPGGMPEEWIDAVRKARENVNATRNR